MAARYVADATRVLCRRWDDELVAYDTFLGTTHLLTDTAAEALEALLQAERPWTLDELGTQLFSGGDAEAQDRPPLSADELQALAAIVERLQQLGLVASPAEPPAQ